MKPTKQEHIAYLQAHKNCQCLQPNCIPFENALWHTEHGAVTLDRAIELDRLRESARPASTPQLEDTIARVFEDERFIEMFGFSSRLD